MLEKERTKSPVIRKGSWKVMESLAKERKKIEEVGQMASWKAGVEDPEEMKKLVSL